MDSIYFRIVFAVKADDVLYRLPLIYRDSLVLFALGMSVINNRWITCLVAYPLT